MKQTIAERDSERRRILVELLDHWHDFFDEPGPEGTGDTVDPDRPMPADWTLFSSQQWWPSVQETRRLLGELQWICRKRKKGHVDHLIAFTVNATWRTVDLMVKVKNAHGKTVLKPERIRERIVPKWIHLWMVDAALDYMLNQWDQKVPLELPPCMTRRLRPLADSDGWTEAA